MSRRASFWTLATVLALLLFGAGAPTPLYVVFQARFHFSAITLTVIFAVYVAALLAALLVTGSLSDRVGRKPPLLVALGVQVVGMIAFALAEDSGWLIGARLLQGIATGVATGALGAALLDTQAPHRPLGALVTSAAPLLGLAVGALATGLLVQYGPDPLHLVFWLLAGAYALAAVAVATMPEPLPGDGGWLAGLRPDVALPPSARATFIAVAPVMLATWSLGGLYSSLGPSVTLRLLGLDSHVVGGLVIVTLMGTGGITSALTHGAAAPRLMRGGAAFVIAGVAITLVGVATESTPAFFGGSLVAGLGFGPAFTGAFRTVTGFAAAHERAGLVAAIYIVCYSAFSLPAIAAGIAVTHVGLKATALIYGAAVAALAASVIPSRPARPRGCPTPSTSRRSS